MLPHVRNGVRHSDINEWLIHWNMGPNDQVERRADATPAQKANMNRHVRSNAGLGRMAVNKHST